MIEDSRLSKLFQLAGVQPEEQFSIRGVKGIEFKLRNDFQLLNYNPCTACWEITHNFDGKLLDVLRGEVSVVTGWSEDEKTIAHAMSLLGYRYIAKDASGSVFVFDQQPYKGDGDGGEWRAGPSANVKEMKFEFPLLSYEDEKPTELESIWRKQC